MKAFFKGLFMISVFYHSQFTASAGASSSGFGLKKPQNSNNQESPSGRGAAMDAGGGSDSSSDDVQPSPNESEEGHTAEAVLESLEQRTSNLAEKLKQMSVQLTTEWNRDGLLQTVLAADGSLSALKQLNHQDLPPPVRNKVEKLEHSVENIKTTVYLLIKSRDLEHHNFTGKIGNNSVSLERLREWVKSLSNRVLELEQNLHPSSENKEIVAKEVTFALKQVFIFVDRIGREFIPLELQTELRYLNESVVKLVNTLAMVDESENIANRLKLKIESLHIILSAYQESTTHKNSSWFFHSMKQTLTGIMTEIKRSDVPNDVVLAAEDLKNNILTAENFFLIQEKPVNNGVSTQESTEYEARLSKLEKVLDNIGRKISFSSKTSTFMEVKKNILYVLDESDEINEHNIPNEVKKKLFLIYQRATKYKKMAMSITAYYESPQTAGLNSSLISIYQHSEKTFEEAFNVLRRQSEHLQTIFQLTHNVNVLLTIKYQTEKIMKHLKYLEEFGTLTTLQKRLTESLLEDTEYFLHRINTTANNEMRSHSQNEKEVNNHRPLNNNETHYNTSDPENNIDYLNSRLHQISSRLNTPLNISRVQYIHKTVLNILTELRTLDETRISKWQQYEVRRLKQRGIEYALLTLLSSQGQADETKMVVINGQNNELGHRIKHAETFFDELQKQINSIPVSSDYRQFFNNLLNILIQLQRPRPSQHLGDKGSISKPNSSVPLPPIPQEILTRNQTLSPNDVNNHINPLISARVDSFQNYFIYLVDRVSFHGDISHYEEYKVQVEEMLWETQHLMQSTDITQDMKTQIEDLDEDLKRFITLADLMLGTEINHADLFSGEDKMASNDNFGKQDESNSESVIKTMENIKSELQVLGRKFTEESSLSNTHQINVRVHHILLEVKLVSWRAPRSLREEIVKLEQTIKRFVRVVELKVVQIRETQHDLQQIPDPTSTSQNKPSSILTIFDQIYQFESVLGQLKKHSNQEKPDQSKLSHLFHQLENMVLTLRKLRLKSERSFDTIIKLLIQKVRILQNKTAQLMQSLRVVDTPEHVHPSQRLSIEEQINQLYHKLNRLTRQLYYRKDPSSLILISTELNQLLPDLKHLKELGLRSRFKNQIDHLFETAENLKTKVEHASVGKVHIEEYPTQAVYNTNDVNKELVDLSVNLSNIEERYFSAKGQLGLIKVLSEISDIADKLLVLKSSNTSPNSRKSIDQQLKVAASLLKTVKEQILVKIMFHIISEIDRLLLRLPAAESLKRPEDEILQVLQELFLLGDCSSSPTVTNDVLQIRKRIIFIVKQLIDIAKQNDLEEYQQISTRLTDIIKSYL